MHTCDKCKKQFDRKDNYNRHLQKKIPCDKKIKKMEIKKK